MNRNKVSDIGDKFSKIKVDSSSKLVIAVVLLVIFVIALALLIGHSVSAEKVPTQKALKDIGYVTSQDVASVPVKNNSQIKAEDDLSVSEKSVVFTDYTVAEGDTLSAIAQHFGISTNTLLAVNNIKKSIKAGDILSIPDRDGTIFIAQSKDTLSAIVHTLNLQISWKELRDLNGLTESIVKPGQKLFIPSQDSKVSAIVQNSEFSNPLSGGRVVGLFNQRTNHPITGELVDLDGVLIQTLVDGQVKVAANGYILDKSFNENGTCSVTVFHAGGYTTFYDYLSDVSVNAGDIISEGTVLGKVKKNNTSLPAATLFFRIELEGMALNPSSFF